MSEAAAAEHAEEEEETGADDDDILRDHEGNVYFPLNAKKRVTVSTFKKMTLGMYSRCNGATCRPQTENLLNSRGRLCTPRIKFLRGVCAVCPAMDAWPYTATWPVSGTKTYRPPPRAVRIGEVYEKDGEMRPGKGISLTVRCCPCCDYSEISSETPSLTAHPKPTHLF